MKKAIAWFGSIALTVALALAIAPVRRLVEAQLGPTVPYGSVFATSLYSPTSTTGQAGTVTNPSSNFIINVSGGPIYCNGNLSTMAPSQLTLAASQTYLVVYNCPQELIYAKQAVTGPGSQTGQPGVPTSLLFPTPGIEVGLATVVCNATACGNGGNGTITDNRTVGEFGSGALSLGSVVFANLPTVANGSVLYCSDCTVASAPCTGSSTGALATRVNGAWRCQ